MMLGQSVRLLMVLGLVLGVCCFTHADARALSSGDSGTSDFEMNVLPRFRRAIRGGDAAFAVQLLSATNQFGTLEIRVEGLHESMIALFSPTVTLNNESFVRVPIRVLTSTTTPTGTYEFNVTLRKGTVEHTQTVELRIQETFFGVLELAVTDTSGNRVPDAFVAAYYKCCLLYRPPDEPEAVGITDLNGTIELTDLLEGRYSVGAFAEGYYEGGAFFEVYPGQTTMGTISMKVRPWTYDWLQLFIVGGIAAAIAGVAVYFLSEGRKDKVTSKMIEKFERRPRGRPRTEDLPWPASGM